MRTHADRWMRLALAYAVALGAVVNPSLAGARQFTVSAPQPFSLPGGITGSILPAAQVDGCGLLGYCPRDFLAFRVSLDAASTPLKEARIEVPDRHSANGEGYTGPGVNPDGGGFIGVGDVTRFMWQLINLFGGQTSSTLVTAFPDGALPGSVGGAFTFLDPVDGELTGPDHVTLIESHCGDGVLDTDPGLYPETCDDGNGVDDDCCSNNCVLSGDGDPCSDHSRCTTGETCTAGVCGGSTPVTCAVCETCYPAYGCVRDLRDFYTCKEPVVPHKSKLILKDRTPDTGDLLTLKWQKGAATTPAELGDPLTTDDYQLCVFDGTGHLILGALAPAGGTCGSTACWKPIGSLGFKYKDALHTPSGLDRMKLRSGVAGKAVAIVVGRGSNLAMPPLGSALTLPLIVQLQRENGPCWQAIFMAGDVLRNDAKQFQGLDTPLP